MATMLPSKSKSGLSEASNNKRAPETPRVSKVGRAGSLKSEANSPSPVQNPRHSVDRSPRSVDSKPAVERRSPKISTPDKQPRQVKGSELQAQLVLVQEDLKKAKEQLASIEKEKNCILGELKDAKRLADEANEKLQEALVAKNRAEEATEIEKFRADELEQVGIDAAQKREEEWQKDLERIQNQHDVDVAALASTEKELERLRHELIMNNDAKNAALGHADEAMRIAEINAEKVELLSGEVGRLKALLDSKVESDTNQTSELVKKLESEIAVLKGELEKARVVEEKLTKMEAMTEELRAESADAKKAELDAGRLVDEWKNKAMSLEVQLEEANLSEKFKTDSLASIAKQLEENGALLKDKESEIAALREKMEILELEVARLKTDLDESSQRFDAVQQEVFELQTTIEVVRNKLQTSEEEKLEALSNEKIASSKIESLSEERNKLLIELETTKDEEEKAKKAMEDLAAALHEASSEAREAQERFLAKETEEEHARAQIGDLKLALKNTQESYEVMLDEANYEIVCLQKTIERLEEEASDYKEELNSKDINFASSSKQSEEEIAAGRLEMHKAMESLRVAEHDLQAAKEDNAHILDKLRQVESAETEANKAVEEAKVESLLLKERLLDKENELQSITQENEDLRIREAAAVQKINELSVLLAEAREKKTEVNGEKSDSDGEPTLPLNLVDSPVENSHVDGTDKPKPETANGSCKDEMNVQEEDSNGNAEQDEALKAEVHMKSDKIMEKDLSAERDHEAESLDDDLDSKMDNDSSDHTNGLPSEDVYNGPNMLMKEQQQQKKKKPLLQKFGSLLKKKNSQKEVLLPPSSLLFLLLLLLFYPFAGNRIVGNCATDSHLCSSFATTMLASKSRSGVSEASSNKSTPPSSTKTTLLVPRVARLSKTGPTKSDHDSASPQHNARVPLDKSPASVDSKNTAERRSPKITPRINTPSDKQSQILKPSELQAQLAVVQEDLKKAKEQLTLIEKEKTQVLEELKDARRLTDETHEKLEEALAAQMRAEETSEIEKFRAIELEQASIDAAQQKEEEWKKRLEAVEEKQTTDAAALVATTKELERVKHELAKSVDAKHTAMSHADDVIKIAKLNAEKVELLSAEVSRLKVLLDSELESKAKEAADIIKRLESEVSVLKAELEKAKAAEEKLTEMETLIEGLTIDVANAKRAESDAGQLVDEWKMKVELLEIRLQELDQSNKSKDESLSSVIEKLEETSALLQDKDSDISHLKEKVELLELEAAKHKEGANESSQQFDAAQQEALELKTTIEGLKSKLQTAEEAKMEAINNEKIATSKIESMLEERNKLLIELETTKDDGEKVKKAMEDLASALHEVSYDTREAQERVLEKQAEIENAQSEIEELKATVKKCQESYKIMLDEANYETVCLRKTVEQLEAEAKNSKDDWRLKEISFMSSVNKSEEEMSAIKLEMDKVQESLRGAEREIQAARKDESQLLNKLRQVESKIVEANLTGEEAKAEGFRLKERLLDKENELQSIIQENEELRIREAAALAKIDELSALLSEATAKKAEVNDALTEAEKSTVLTKSISPPAENVYEEVEVIPTSEVLTVEVEECHKDNKNRLEENGKENADEEPVIVDIKMWESSKIIENDLSKEGGHESESVDEESNVDDSIFNQTNGSSLEKMESRETSPPKQQQQKQRKKKPLLKKFGSLLKKKTHCTT
ncbi:uncharacterized protein [Typha angustifolia]|uniref:uncharacterized protein n=1 Tax=Typha angustifolia TaxID=59011 RepID=UPI003C2BEF29